MKSLIVIASFFGTMFLIWMMIGIVAWIGCGATFRECLTFDGTLTCSIMIGIICACFVAGEIGEKLFKD